MLQSVNSKKLTNVKLHPNSLTNPTILSHYSHTTLTLLSLCASQKMFVLLRTIRSNSRNLIVKSSYGQAVPKYLNRYFFGSSTR